MSSAGGMFLSVDRRRGPRAATAALLLAAWVSSPPASATEPSGRFESPSGADAEDETKRPAEAHRVETVVVTARRVEQNLQEVPVGETVLSAREIEETATLDTEDLGLRVPNLTTTSSVVGTALILQLRGQTQGVDVVGTIDPAVGFYDDGFYAARPHGANTVFVDVDSVQVLRGPQGTLFGRNTTGGALLLTTNDPDFERASGTLAGTVGSFGRRSLALVANAPIVPEVLAIRLVGHTLRTSGFAFDETNRRDIATEESDLIRLKILYRPAPTLSFLLKGQAFEVDQLLPPVQPFFALRPEQAREPAGCCLGHLNSLASGVDFDAFTGGDVDRVNFDSGLKPTARIGVRILNLTTTWHSRWATFKLLTGVRQNHDVAVRLDADGTPSKIVDVLEANENLEQVYELQATGWSFGDRLAWATGATFFDESGNEGRNGRVIVLDRIAGPAHPLITDGDIDNRSAAVYAQGTWSLTERLRITGGLRYTHDRRRLVLQPSLGGSCSLPPDQRDDGRTCKGTFDDSFGDVSFLAGTDYSLLRDVKPFDDVLLYASVSSGYRAGGQNLRGTSAETLRSFRPETVLSFEAGFKSELLEHRVRLNGTGFYVLYEDLQRPNIIATESGAPATRITNAARAEIAGAEIELDALPPIEGLRLGAALGLTKPRYTKFTDAVGDRSGERFDFVPDLSYSLSGVWVREILGVAWSNRLDWSWTSEIAYQQGELRYFRSQGFDFRSDLTQPPVGILGARSSVRFPNGLELGLFGRNLTDERTFVPLVLGGGPDLISKQYSNTPREIGFEAAFRF